MRILLSTLPAAAALLLVACATTPTTTLPIPDAEVIRYRCAGDLDVVITYAGRATGQQGTAELVWDSHSFPLRQDVSAGGGRYTDGTLTLFTKGDEAFVEKAGEIVLKDCNAQL